MHLNLMLEHKVKCCTVGLIDHFCYGSQQKKTGLYHNFPSLLDPTVWETDAKVLDMDR